MKYVFFVLLILSFKALAQDPFIELVKKTASVYSVSSDIDAANDSEIFFETLLSGQKVYLITSAKHLNSSVFTLVNADPEFSKRRKIDPPIININNLTVEVDGSVTPTASCDGSGVVASEYSCSGENCTVAQRVISKCNELNCWKLDSSTDRELISPLSEQFGLSEKIDITDCIPNHTAGEKHTLTLKVTNVALGNLAGGSLNTILILQNDVAELSKRRVK